MNSMPNILLRWGKEILWGVFWGTVVGLLLLWGYSTRKQVRLETVERKEIVCPSFLSIARSARDTLIVMRNEPLCADFVLDNLK